MLALAAGEKIAEIDALEEYWQGASCHIQLFHCIIDHKTIKSKFLTQFNSKGHLGLKNCNSDDCRDVSVWEDVAVCWNDVDYHVTTESFTDNMHPDYICPNEFPYSSIARLATGTPTKCETKFNECCLFIKRTITAWETSGQGDGGFVGEFGALEGRSEHALSSRASFVNQKTAHFLYLWALVDKYDLLKSCMQLLSSEFAAGNGAGAVRQVYDLSREEGDNESSSLGSTQFKTSSKGEIEAISQDGK